MYFEKKSMTRVSLCKDCKNACTNLTYTCTLGISVLDLLHSFLFLVPFHQSVKNKRKVTSSVIRFFCFLTYGHSKNDNEKRDECDWRKRKNKRQSRPRNAERNNHRRYKQRLYLTQILHFKLLNHQSFQIISCFKLLSSFESNLKSNIFRDLLFLWENLLVLQK